MTAHDVPFLWCILQAALLSMLGVAAAWLFARRAPAAGATGAAVAAAMIAVVTLLIPVRVPKVELWTPSQSGNLVDAMASAALNENVTVDESPSSGSVSFDVEDLAARLLTSMGASGMAEQEFGPLIESSVVGLFALGAAVGTLRFLWALSFVARLRRDRAPIVDDEASRLFAELKSRLCVVRSVELCESPRIASPAVIGWRRPIVLLPVERADWTEEQLRATLAHELAHVVRGDFFWRSVAGATQAIHFFHPLVHLLTRRLTLMQELATDRLAAAAAGGSATYLRALSELAIRLDDQSRLRAEPIVLPALSSNLMRRIVMLRSKEGSEAGRNHRLASAVAVGLIAIAGLGTMALRGNAEAVESTAATGGAASGPLFARTPFDATSLAREDAGLFVIRVGELAERPALAPVFEFQNELTRETWQAAFGVEAPEIQLEALEYVAGTPTLTLKPKTPEAMGQMMIGCENLVLRFRREVAWKEWILKHMPGAEAATDDGFEYVKLPALPAFGPTTYCLAARDERTLVIAANVDRLRKLAANEPTVEGPTAAAWNSLEGGLVTIASPVLMGGELAAAYREDVQQLGDAAVSASDPSVLVMQAICLNVEQFGAAFDLDPTTNQSAVRLTMSCRDQAAAEKVRAAVTVGLAAAKPYFQMMEHSPPRAVPGVGEPPMVQTAGTPDTERQVARWYRDLAQNYDMQLAPRADGLVDLRIEMRAEFPGAVFTKYESAATLGADEAKRR